MAQPCPNPEHNMQLSDLLSVDTIACDIEAGSKKRVLEQIGGMIADSQPSLSQNQVFESLIGRERLGSTGLGHGVAIPHGRLKNSDITTAAFVKLKQPIDYDSSDGKPVDLLCALLVPEESTQEHLNLLSSLAYVQ